MLIDSQTKVYEKAPTGVYDAVVADWIDLGMVPGKFGPKHKIRIIYILTAKDSEGNNYRAMNQVTASMFEKAKLYGIVKDILGEPPVLTGPKGSFDINQILGRNVQLVVSLEKGLDGKEHSNIKAILPPKVSFVVPPTFVRDKDRTDKKTPAAQTTSAQTAAPASAPAAQAAVVDEEEIPF